MLQKMHTEKDIHRNMMEICTFPNLTKGLKIGLLFGGKYFCIFFNGRKNQLQILFIPHMIKKKLVFICTFFKLGKCDQNGSKFEKI